MSCGALSSTKLVPELQYWVNQTVVSSSLNKNSIPASIELNPILLPMSSFIELLFNDNSQQTSYQYIYFNDTSKASWPSAVTDRVMIYANSAQYYRIYDGTSPVDATSITNLFVLQQDDFTLLDGLLAYRMDSTGTSLIDSTSITSVTTTPTGTIIRVYYDGLSTNLSKLIYHYLNLKINGQYAAYDTTTLIAGSDELLESCYEAYVIEQMFQFMSDRGT